MSIYILNRAILNRNALDDDQRKAMFARLGGHGGGTSYGGSASKAADAAYKRRSAKAARMGVDLALGMIGGVGIAGEAKAATPLAKTVGNIIRQARARLTGNTANGMVHPELNALNELSAGAKALKDKALQEHGFVDEATSGALRTLRAEEDSIRMGVSKADQVADDLWAHSAPDGGGPDPFATAVRDARPRVAARLRADRAAQKSTSVAESSGRYTPTDQARRDALAAELRRDRELKRLDLHPELFFGNRMPPARSDEERQRRAFFAKGGGPSTVRTETNQPGRTSVTVTETGFPRSPVQPGRANPPRGIADQFGPPVLGPQTPKRGSAPPAVPEPGPAPQQGTQAYRDWLKRYAEWERSQPGYELRPWGAGSGSATPSDRAAKAKADADKIMARAAAKRKQSQGMYPGALQDTGESSFFSKAQLKPAPNSPLARFLALPTLRG